MTLETLPDKVTTTANYDLNIKASFILSISFTRKQTAKFKLKASDVVNLWPVLLSYRLSFVG